MKKKSARKSNKYALFYVKFYSAITDVKRLNSTNRITSVKTLALADLLFANTSLLLGFSFPLQSIRFVGSPKIPAGSTSLLVFMSAIGVVLNVDRQSRKSVIRQCVTKIQNVCQFAYIFYFCML